MVRVEGAELGFDEGLRQRLEALGRAVPGELVGRIGQRGAEVALEAAAHQRVQAVGRDDQVVARELIQRLDRGVVTRRRRRPRRTRACRSLQQFKPADRGEADAVDLDTLAAQIERDVRSSSPSAARSRRPSRDRRRAGIPAPGRRTPRRSPRWHRRDSARTGRSRRPGCRRLPEIGEVEAAGASADHGDAHDLLPD